MRNLPAALEPIQTRITGLAGTAKCYGRFENCRRRLEDAVGRLRAGDDTALTKPLSGSYQDVWMELHQVLMDTPAGSGWQPTATDNKTPSGSVVIRLWYSTDVGAMYRCLIAHTGQKTQARMRLRFDVEARSRRQ